MDINSLLIGIENLAESKGISRPLIVGGFPRDQYLKRFNDFTDIDLTTGDADVHTLALEVYQALSPYDPSYQVLQDGHAQIKFSNFKLDFSSNFKLPNIDQILVSKNIKRPSELLKELYCRDFTCNTLLMTLDRESIFDLTKLAIPDLKAKIIRCILSPAEVFINTKRVFRVPYLAAKLGFSIDPTIYDYLKQHPEFKFLVHSSSHRDTLLDALEYNSALTKEFLTATGYLAEAMKEPKLAEKLA